jgi:tetratricopeptide (TPR) repeat protein
MKSHPHDLLLQEVAASRTGGSQEVLDHLITCESCRKRVQALKESDQSGLASRVLAWQPHRTAPVSYGPVLESLSRSLPLLESKYQRERAEALQLFAELSRHPEERRTLIVSNSARFHTWSLCELLLQRSMETNFVDAAQGERLAFLAIEILDHLSEAEYGAEPIEDLRARAWSYVGNSRRVKSDLRGAEEAFALALAHLRRGTQEPMERAVLLDLRASLLRAQRRLPEALRSLHRAIKIFRQLGERHRAGRAMVNMFTIYYALGHTFGEPETGIQLLYDAIKLIDPAREPRLVLIAWHNLVVELTETGRLMEAQKWLAKARPLYRKFPQPWFENPRNWIEGKIAHGLGQHDRAETFFITARDGFLAADAAYDTALVSLELAALYAEQGRMADLKRVAEQTVPIFSSRQIHREALAALSYWRQAVEGERAGATLMAGVAAFLKRARLDPELRFQNPDQASTASE